MACFHSSLVLHDFFSLITKYFASQFVFRTFVSFLYRGLADLPVGFPYRFNSSWSYIYKTCWIFTDTLGAFKRWCQGSLTLSLPIFWQICLLSATFISAVRGIMPYEASTFSKILILQFFLLIAFNKYPNCDLSKLKTPWAQQNVCKWGTENNLSFGFWTRQLLLTGRGVTIYRYITIHKKFISYRNTKCVSRYIATFLYSI